MDGSTNFVMAHAPAHRVTFKVLINCCLQLLLYLRVQGQQVGGVGQGVGGCLVASQEERDGVCNNLLISEPPPSPTLSLLSCVNHQLKEILVLRGNEKNYVMAR